LLISFVFCSFDLIRRVRPILEFHLSIIRQCCVLCVCGVVCVCVVCVYGVWCVCAVCVCVSTTSMTSSDVSYFWLHIRLFRLSGRVVLLFIFCYFVFLCGIYHVSFHEKQSRDLVTSRANRAISVIAITVTRYFSASLRQTRS